MPKLNRFFSAVAQLQALTDHGELARDSVFAPQFAARFTSFIRS